MQSLDTLDTLHYSILGPASGNTSLLDVDSSRFAGCTSGARTVQSLWGLLGGLASATPPSRLPPSLLFLLPSPSSLPAPALITDAAATNFHLAGAAPPFARGQILFVLITRLGCFFKITSRR